MRLWVTRIPPLRFFLVPEGQALPPGDVVVESTALQLASVDLDAMAAWSVSVRQARKWQEANAGAIDAEREALGRNAEASLEAVTAAMSDFIDSSELRGVLAALGLDPVRLTADMADTGQMVEALMGLVSEASLSEEERGRRARKIMRQHGHLDANRALRRDPESLARLLAALEAALDTQLS